MTDFFARQPLIAHLPASRDVIVAASYFGYFQLAAMILRRLDAILAVQATVLKRKIQMNVKLRRAAVLAPVVAAFMLTATPPAVADPVYRYPCEKEWLADGGMCDDQTGRQATSDRTDGPAGPGGPGAPSGPDGPGAPSGPDGPG